MKPIHTPEYTRMRERLKEARKAVAGCVRARYVGGEAAFLFLRR